MLQTKYRLRRPADIQHVRQAGHSWRHPLVILLAKPNTDQVSRFAFVASRQVGNAVQRNRGKRLLREAVRLHLEDVQPGWDCVFIARAFLSQASYAEVETAVLQLFRRAQLQQSPHP